METITRNQINKAIETGERVVFLTQTEANYILYGRLNYANFINYGVYGVNYQCWLYNGVMFIVGERVPLKWCNRDKHENRLINELMLNCLLMKNSENTHEVVRNIRHFVRRVCEHWDSNIQTYKENWEMLEH